MKKDRKCKVSLKLAIVIPLQTLIERKPESKDKRLRESSDLKEAMNLLKTADPNLYLPIVLPLKNTEDNENANLIHDIFNEQGSLNEDHFFMFQFPRILPINSEKLMQNEAEEKEAPEHDKLGNVKKKEFENLFKDLPKNSKLGKLKFYKSGKVKMQIGDNLFDVGCGITARFAQEIAVVSKNTNEAVFLGKLKDKNIVITPELNI
jgi:hypothetical protein